MIAMVHPIDNWGFKRWRMDEEGKKEEGIFLQQTR
jgi:hypothetical protein